MSIENADQYRITEIRLKQLTRGRTQLVQSTEYTHIIKQSMLAALDYRIKELESELVQYREGDRRP